MKSWQKAVLLSGVVCIALVVLSMLVAYGIMATSGLATPSSNGSSTFRYKPKAHREKPGVEPYLERESHDKPEKPSFEPVEDEPAENSSEQSSGNPKPQGRGKTLDLDDQ